MTDQKPNSVQDQQPDGFSYGLSGIINYKRNEFPAWGLPQRDYHLRQLVYNEHNTLTVGALTNLIRRVKQTPWELSGGRNLTRRYQQLMQEAQFGEGWDAFLSRLLQDLLTLDNGAFIEIQGPGNPDEPLTRAASGIAVLDGLRCYATGNEEYPVYYRSLYGRLHKLHWTRVIRLVDMPSPDPRYRGLGLSALSRALSVVQTDILMNKYLLEKLDDLPPKGFLVITGPTKEQWDQVTNKHEFERLQKKQEVYQNLVEFRGISDSQNLDLKIVPFSGLPDQFNRRELFDIAVQYLALAIGDDPQEIAALSGSGLGATATQSQVLHTKGKGRIFGDILTLLERTLNIAVLPASLEFNFRPKDTEQSREEAETARSWSFMVRGLVTDGIMRREDAARLLANTVETFRDVMLDETGLVRLPDDDVEAEEEQTVLDDAVTASTPTAEEVIALSEQRQQKSIQSTRLNFETAFADVLAQREGLSRRRFGIVLRSLISRYGNMAYEDGMIDGGVSPLDKTDEDRSMIARLTASQSRYVTALANSLYRNGVTVSDPEARAVMWWNKSISPFYRAALRAANRNGMFEWVLGPTEHCKDCLRLNGQRHRMKDWERTGWVPQADKLECKGFNCQCRLVPAQGQRARGRF